MPEDWRPTAGWTNLRRRADLLARIRAFFSSRGVLEIETPLLGVATATDPHIHSLTCQIADPTGSRTLYLQTSPELAMKRLLAAGSGPIYQICKAFRGAEAGRLHNPEFTILEWYRPGFDHHALMDEMDELLAEVLACDPAERRTYREIFQQHLALDPLGAATEDLRRCITAQGIAIDGLASSDRDTCLQLLFSHSIEPRLGSGGRPTYVLDFPVSQAALARIRREQPPVAERFEVFVEGVELANGYHELADPAEQRRRFSADLKMRGRLGLEQVATSEHLLAALEAGLPPCAGVALGVDRLVMLETGAGSLEEVLSFPFERA